MINENEKNRGNVRIRPRFGLIDGQIDGWIQGSDQNENFSSSPDNPAKYPAKIWPDIRSDSLQF